MPRKVFTAGEILTAADVNTNLMDQSVMVFDDASARTTAIPTPVEGMVTYLKDTDEVDKFDGSAFVPVGIAPAILQVVQTVKTDTFTGSSGAFTTVTGLSATITPSSVSNKILVLVQLVAGIGGTNLTGAAFKVTGGNADTYRGDTDGSLTRAVFGAFNEESAYAWRLANLSYPISFLDSPSTTGSVTYQVEGFVTDGVFHVNRSGTGTDDRFTRGASSIILMEVAG